MVSTGGAEVLYERLLLLGEGSSVPLPTLLHYWLQLWALHPLQIGLATGWGHHDVESAPIPGWAVSGRFTSFTSFYPHSRTARQHLTPFYR